MSATPCRGFRFPKATIQHAIWLYLRFTLSLREVEKLLAERGIVVTYETVRTWVACFGPLIGGRLRRRCGLSSGIWQLDEMFVNFAGREMYLWRAVDSEGEVLDMLVQRRRDKAAALPLMRKLLKSQGMAPTCVLPPPTEICTRRRDFRSNATFLQLNSGRQMSRKTIDLEYFCAGWLFRLASLTRIEEWTTSGK